MLGERVKVVGVNLGCGRAARAAEDLFIREYKLIKRGLNRINGVSLSNKNRKLYFQNLLQAMRAAF